MGGREEKDVTYLGVRRVWDEKKPFGLRQADRRQHLYTVGQTGVGKSTMLRNLILQDIEAGKGISFIDPHGDLAEEILDYIPSRRTEDLVYFNPADQAYPMGLNLLQTVPRERRHLAVSGVLSALKGIWRDSWGPRLEYILSNALSALLECENVSLLGVQRMLSDERYRRWIVKQVTDPIVRSFWLDEFERYDAAFRREAIAPIQNKVGQLLMAAPLRNIIGQVKSAFDPGFMMGDRRILIANLSKGALGEEAASLLGAILVTQFQLAAMSRVNTPEAERVDHTLVVDEFQNMIASSSLASMLSEARKYRLSLVLSHQYLDQLERGVREAIFGNVGSIVSFRVGTRDADILARELNRAYNPSTFTELKNHHVCAKLMDRGEHTEPFLAETLPPVGTRHGRKETLIRRSREKYAARREVIEDKINRWIGR